MKGDGTTKEQKIVVKKSSRYTVKVSDVLGQGNDTGHDFSSEVACTSGQKIIAERPMYFCYTGGHGYSWTGGHDVVGFTP